MGVPEAACATWILPLGTSINERSIAPSTSFQPGSVRGAYGVGDRRRERATAGRPGKAAPVAPLPNLLDPQAESFRTDVLKLLGSILAHEDGNRHRRRAPRTAHRRQPVNLPEELINRPRAGLAPHVNAMSTSARNQPPAVCPK